MSEYWTQIEKDALHDIENFEQLVEVAYTILRRMPKPVVMVCGPMSTGGEGTLEKNMTKFAKAVAALEGSGLTVFNQIPFQDAMVKLCALVPEKEYCDDILERFYRKIFENGFIDSARFLSDWSSSRGASWEHELLSALGIEILDYPEHLLIENSQPR